MPGNLGEPKFREEEASPLRKAIAGKMVESKSTVPHFYLMVDVDAQPIIDFRNKLNEEGDVKVSYNDIIMKAIGEAFRLYPQYNVAYVEGKLHYYEEVNVSLAVAVEGGLLTPTVRNCDTKSVYEIAESSRTLIEKARNKKIRATEQMGGVITLTNLGMFGIDEFIAIINIPQSMILAVGAIRDEAVVKDGQIVAGKRMKMTLSVDHRALDGAMASTFLMELKRLIEEPEEIEQ